jgi:hypothetical protein
MRLDSGNNEPCLFAEPLKFVEILTEDFDGHISRVPVMVSSIRGHSVEIPRPRNTLILLSGSKKRTQSRDAPFAAICHSVWQTRTNCHQSSQTANSSMRSTT